ncbi:hypothetical protein FACS189496_1610 [Bacilli bacterium]|nr:hypothetical protein FACS189496_1610 [Bacilli bacterium]
MRRNNYLLLLSLLMNSPYVDAMRFKSDEADLARIVLERDLQEHFFMERETASLIASVVKRVFDADGFVSRQRYLEEIERVLQKSEQDAAQKATTLKNDMVSIPGGTFTMGTGRGARQYHVREKYIRVAPFFMSQYTVLQDEFENLMGYNPAYIKGPEFPAESISWYEAVEYCNKRSIMEGFTPVYSIDKENPPPDYEDDRDPLKWNVTWDKNADGFRLPTQAEWEYACRAGTTGDFYSGDFINTGQANYNNNYIVPSGQFAPNSWGLYDMHGNIWEWCWDSLWDNGVQAFCPCSYKYKRIIRGGAYCYGSTSISSWYAMPSEQYRLGYIGPYGIRLVRSNYIWSNNTTRSLKDG